MTRLLAKPLLVQHKPEASVQQRVQPVLLGSMPAASPAAPVFASAKVLLQDPLKKRLLAKPLLVQGKPEVSVQQEVEPVLLGS